MLSENGDVIKIDTTGRQTTRPDHSTGVVVWTGESDTKTISVDANLFENGAKQLRFCLKTA